MTRQPRRSAVPRAGSEPDPVPSTPGWVSAIMLVATLVLRARRELTGLMVLTAAIQVVDAIVDGAGGRWTLVPGVLALGVAFLVGAARLSPRPLWLPGTWRDTAIRESPPNPPASLDGGLGG